MHDVFPLLFVYGLTEQLIHSLRENGKVYKKIGDIINNVYALPFPQEIHVHHLVFLHRSKELKKESLLVPLHGSLHPGIWSFGIDALLTLTKLKLSIMRENVKCGRKLGHPLFRQGANSECPQFLTAGLLQYNSANHSSRR